jgi:hypothetical protein
MAHIRQSRSGSRLLLETFKGISSPLESSRERVEGSLEAGPCKILKRGFQAPGAKREDAYMKTVEYVTFLGKSGDL